MGLDQVLKLERPSGRREYQVFVSRLLTAPETGRTQNAVGVVFIADPEDQHLAMPEMLATLYGLTAAEAELVTLLCQGETLDEAARIRGVSAHTARSQLKSVFSKTGVSRQADLVRLLCTSVTGLADGPGPKKRAS
jgi:DNA-binding CsgD family transcriptional regulator